MNVARITLFRWNHAGNERHQRVAGIGFEIEHNGFFSGEFVKLQELRDKNCALAFEKGCRLFVIEQLLMKFIVPEYRKLL